MTVGVISDTHGLLRREALDALRGSDAILHAGDIGSRDVLEGLGELAPVFAVRGNIDAARWARTLHGVQALTFESTCIYLLHDLHQLDLDPAVAGINAVVHGHSHRPTMEWKAGVLYFNPGSAGPRRFKLPVTVGQFVIEGASLKPEIIDIL